ncbi:MAG: hypothetical protein ACJ762_11125 [Solirubrobacteraceae bacterium]
MRIAARILVALALLGGPAAALGQDNPLGPLPTPAPTTPDTVVVNAPAADDGGLEGWQKALIFGSGFVLLGGIAWAIVSDARHRAPVKDGELAHPGLDGPIKSNRSQKQRERDRAKAKVAKAQRKRNRPR